ncbi:RIP metalloprotease RseP [Burkholderia sp. WAC0059]|uniref:RIP metalloprotease RseP n=1 Tax=Burkholderia sp. WAC0059 TaxID=2066022 RepID=UPI000C7EDF2D|nr:RIP metalloprotease RseP [Burkholderia sp. WAC0059]PLZ02078.1 RIP metalloprotease RseP [Burkholderia sp. WAC0059]
MNLLTEVVAFAVAIGVLVVVHEFGHYSVARWCGVKILRFSIGFGRPIVQWVDRRTGTEWSIALLPLGGYVKMLDERDALRTIPAQDLPHAFNRQSVGKRIAIVSAGPIANFVLAVLLFTVVFSTGVNEPQAIVAAPPSHTAAAQAGFQGGEKIVSIISEGETKTVRSWSDLRWKLLAAAFDRGHVVLVARDGNGVYDFPLDLSRLSSKDLDDDFMVRLGLDAGGGALQVMDVEPNSAAQRAGLAAGDRLKAIDGRPVDSASTFIAYVEAHAGEPLQLQVERGTPGQTVSLTVVPVLQRGEDGKEAGRIGAALAAQVPSVEVRYGLLDSARLGARRTWDIGLYSLRMFGRMLIGQASLKNLSGPVTIADYAGKSARLGPSAFMSFLALVSISLGVLNMLPIPVLDGGHLLYYLVEAVTGKAVSDRWQMMLQRAGLACIVALSAIALFNDLARLIHF